LSADTRTEPDAFSAVLSVQNMLGSVAPRNNKPGVPGSILPADLLILPRPIRNELVRVNSAPAAPPTTNGRLSSIGEEVPSTSSPLGFWPSQPGPPPNKPLPELPFPPLRPIRSAPESSAPGPTAPDSFPQEQFAKAESDSNSSGEKIRKSRLDLRLELTGVENGFFRKMSTKHREDKKNVVTELNQLADFLEGAVIIDGNLKKVAEDLKNRLVAFKNQTKPQSQELERKISSLNETIKRITPQIAESQREVELIRKEAQDISALPARRWDAQNTLYFLEKEGIIPDSAGFYR